jgi:S1-C subfamily serine protease
MNPIVPATSNSPPGIGTGTHDLADAVERVAAFAVGLGTRRRGLAAGVVWQPGVVLTAASAIGHAGQVHVVRPDGETVIGEVRGTDGGTDLAVVSVDTGGAHAAERRLDPPLRPGDFVFAVGRDASGLVHASFGYVAAAGGAWRTWRGGQIDRLVRLDGGLPAGLAGAPVFDRRGQIVGIGTAALSRRGAVVLPVTTVERIGAQLLAHGRVMRGYLGVAVQPVVLSTAMQAAASTTAGSALLVTGVGEPGPAAQGGLLVGDVIVAAGGRELSGIEALRDVLAAERIGSRLALRLLRGGQAMELSVEVGEYRPEGRC